MGVGVGVLVCWWVGVCVFIAYVCVRVREKDQYISNLFVCESVLRSTIIQFFDVLYMCVCLCIAYVCVRERKSNICLIYLCVRVFKGPLLYSLLM